jgi:hypothetical protein
VHGAKATFPVESDVLVYVPGATNLAQTALTALADFLAKNQDFVVAYGDDITAPLPDFSPQRLLSQNYIRGPIALTHSAASEFFTSLQNKPNVVGVHEFLLSQESHGKKIGHIPEPLSSHTLADYLVLTEAEICDTYTMLQNVRESRGGGYVGEYLGSGAFESRGAIVGEPLVSIVIPTRALFSEHQGQQQSLVVNAVRSIVEKSDYGNFECVVVVDLGADPEILSTLQELLGSKLRLVQWTQPFNFSQKMNFGVLHAQGDYVLLLNDDVEVISPQWLSSMLSLVQLPNAGMVGAMLYYEDDSIQHAGHAYYQGSPTHIGLGLPRGSRGPLGGYLVQREAPGVTAACALMPMHVFKAVGGFTALLPGNFNDVDLCLKVGWKGFDIYWTPEAELYHFESKTRDAHVHYYELDVIEHRWGLRLSDTRYWRGHPWAPQ